MPLIGIKPVLRRRDERLGKLQSEIALRQLHLVHRSRCPLAAAGNQHPGSRAVLHRLQCPARIDRHHRSQARAHDDVFCSIAQFIRKRREKTGYGLLDPARDQIDDAGEGRRKLTGKRIEKLPCFIQDSLLGVRQVNRQCLLISHNARRCDDRWPVERRQGFGLVLGCLDLKRRCLGTGIMSSHRHLRRFVAHPRLREAGCR